MANAGLFTRIIDRFTAPRVEKIIEERIKQAVAKSDLAVAKAATGDVVRFSPRTMTLPGGSTPKYPSFGVSFRTLREFADYYPVARACVEYRKSQITHLDW